MSSFSSLNLGARAIFAAQRGLDITGQNIANSATPGYCRQRVDQVAVGGPTVPAIWSKYDQTGGGVKVTGISRMRDEFLEARARTAHETQASYAEQQKVYEAIERTVDEPSAKGLQAQLGEFWNSWSGIANDLTHEAPRDVTFQKALSVATQFNAMGNQLATQWTDARTELDANVKEINATVADIGRLNRAIRNNVINGLPANELADQRDALVERVTTLTGGKAELGEDGIVNVKMGDGNYLVQGQFYRQLQANGPASYDGMTPAVPGAVGITWTGKLHDSSDPTQVVTESLTGDPGIGTGTVKAQLTNLNSTLPSYMTELNTVAQKFVAQVNGTQVTAYKAGGGQATELFGANGSDVTAANVTAANLQVMAGRGPNDLGVSSVDWNVNKELDGNKALEMAFHLRDTAGADAAYHGLVTRLGVEAQSINRNKDAADSVVKTADDARESVSGVSLNEEMTNLMQYQHSFEASAKFITAVDATIESLLNMTR